MNDTEEKGCEDRAKEITFDTVDASDEILIETANSAYRFSLINPKERRGLLSGGSLGNYPQGAVLIGILNEAGGGFSSNPSGLKTCGRPLFYVDSPFGLQRIITSVITNLVHKRNGQQQPDVT